MCRRTRGAWVLALAGVAMAVTGATSGAAVRVRSRRSTHLVERRVGRPPRRVAAGATFTVTDVVRNRGPRPVRGSVRFSLRRHGARIRLGARRVPELAPHRTSRGHTRLTIPARARAGRYALVACADTGHRVRGDCRAARRHVRVVAASGAPGAGPGPPPGSTSPSPSSSPAPAPRPGDTDGDGTPDRLDCAPHDPTIHPGAADLPDVKFVDSNCDGIDGDAAKAIFVSPSGDDANPGTMSRPKQTLNVAVKAAAAAGDDVYAAAGGYTRVDLISKVSIYGGYTPGWNRPANTATLISGPGPEAALANGDTGVTLQLLTLEGNPQSAPGACAYGLRAIDGSSIVLEQDTVEGGAARAGADAANGAAGVAGGAGGATPTTLVTEPNLGKVCGGPYAPYIGGAGGASPAGRPGGAGGNGDSGYSGPYGLSIELGSDSSYGKDGAPGALGSPGGAGGVTGSQGSNGGGGATGAPGADGHPGRGGGNGPAAPGPEWIGFPGSAGTDGQPGNGGGGGGGGGGEACFVDCDAGSGGGGAGGGGGGGAGRTANGGAAGGGSFGVYLFDSTVTIVGASVIHAGPGGAGGRGGDGGPGGAGGIGGTGGFGCSSGAGAGGRGGDGGAGGAGGAGGGGGGGPSIAVYQGGASTARIDPQAKLEHSAGGAGGAGGTSHAGQGGAGQAGIAADVYPVRRRPPVVGPITPPTANA